MKLFGRRSLRQRLIWLTAVCAGLCGGWLAAGVMQDHRTDVPRKVVPTTNPVQVHPQ